jgi:cation diffusion facilitator CzcD-associated flavoprotein CzcO
VTSTVVVGAGPAGLATAACLTRAGHAVTLVERAATVGSAWRHHYERLHLHTDKGRSGLPFVPMPRDYPRYASREQVVAYLDGYAKAMNLAPRLGETVTKALRADDAWEITTTRETIRSRNLVVATGYTQVPVEPSVAGTFSGATLHSSAYRSGAAYAGKRVLVVGFGNSGGEIAIDLVEQGAIVELSVRGEMNVIKRDTLGMPVLTMASLLSWMPAKLADAISWPVNRLLVGNIEKLGLRQLPYGPMQQVKRTGRIPLLDIGTIALIRSGKITVRPGIARFDGDVVFTDDTRGSYDAIVYATGYRPGVASFLDAPGALDADGKPTTSGKPTSVPGLYFIGFYVSPYGMLKAISDEARAIAAAIVGP